jgi:hypothetical protein
MSMGCTILAGVFGPELAGLQDKGTYPNALRDVVIVLWLLSRSPAEVMRINARQNVDEATTEAFLWAETEGIAYGSAKYMDGVRTLTEVVGGIYTSFYNMSSKGKREPDLKNGLSPAGKSVRPTGRSKRRVTTPNT